MSHPELLTALHADDDHGLPEAVARILETGDPALRETAATRVVLLATVIGGSAWRDSARRRLETANSASGLAPTPEQLEHQLDDYQLSTLARIYRSMAALGGEAAADYAFGEAAKESLSLRRRLLAIDLAENLMRSGARRHAAEIPGLAAKLRRALEDRDGMDRSTSVARRPGFSA